MNNNIDDMLDRIDKLQKENEELKEQKNELGASIHNLVKIVEKYYSDAKGNKNLPDNSEDE